MTKPVLVLCAVGIATIAVAVGWLALHYVPSPFASVRLRGDTVVAELRPGVSFLLVRSTTLVAEHIAGSESLELHDGEWVRLGSARTGYHITCRTSQAPAGLQIQGSWHYHDFPRSFIKTWFVEAQPDPSMSSNQAMQLTAGNGAAGMRGDMDGRTREGERSGRNANQARRFLFPRLPSRAYAAWHAPRARGS